MSEIAVGAQQEPYIDSIRMGVVQHLHSQLDIGRPFREPAGSFATYRAPELTFQKVPVVDLDVRLGLQCTQVNTFRSRSPEPPPPPPRKRTAK